MCPGHRFRLALFGWLVLMDFLMATGAGRRYPGRCGTLSGAVLRACRAGLGDDACIGVLVMNVHRFTGFLGLRVALIVAAGMAVTGPGAAPAATWVS